MKHHAFQNLKIWREAYALSLEIFRLTCSFPAMERFTLAHQLRRASISVASNIAEGAGRGTEKDLLRFMHMARGSANEVMCQTMLARDLGYMPDKKAAELLGRYDGLLAGIHAFCAHQRT